MLVFKFGGASVKDAAAVRNVAQVLGNFEGEEILLVLSAMGKNTNLLEKLVDAYIKDLPYQNLLEEFRTFHLNIIAELLGDDAREFYEVDNLLVELECVLDGDQAGKDYDYVYDQIVPYGELVSTRILSHYLNHVGLRNRWLDARNFIVTSSDHRRARIDWSVTEDLIGRRAFKMVQKQLSITQGFIGRTSSNAMTTLGREGSDYTAAIFAYGLNAESVTIWKDVPGVMNADPKRFPDAQLLSDISFKEAIELAYYGASVIHPKTIQPLMRKGIPLHVKSFVDIDEPGTQVADHQRKSVIQLPCYIEKANQVLISLASKDFSFIIEDNLSQIFNALAACGIQVNLMQNTAISFSICANFDQRRIEQLTDMIGDQYHMDLTPELNLFTVFNSHLDDEVKRHLKGAEVLLEQKTGNVLQWVHR
ncbi:MAG: aspartate kinase [Flavobacteriales bacterium]|nr:aspartate kinase [Flavobacteriales bacterium]